MQFAALLRLLASVPPSMSKATATPLPTTASIRAYSAAVAPLSSIRNRENMITIRAGYRSGVEFGSQSIVLML
jgi:hypothetical protein